MAIKLGKCKVNVIYVGALREKDNEPPGNKENLGGRRKYFIKLMNSEFFAMTPFF